jgi:hypothetical protein
MVMNKELACNPESICAGVTPAGSVDKGYDELIEFTPGRLNKTAPSIPGSAQTKGSRVDEQGWTDQLRVKALTALTANAQAGR